MDNHNQSTVKETLLRTQLPERTKSYTPISYKEIIERVSEEINKHGFTVISEIYRASSDGQIGQGNYNIAFDKDPEMNIMVAWQNSYNKQVSFKICSGGLVVVCSNGLAFGDMGAYKRVHKGTADSDSLHVISEQLKSAEEHFDKLIQTREKMKEVELNKRQMSELAGRWFIEEELVTATQLGIIKKEICNPSYDYGTGNNTLWDVFNAATHSFKEEHPRTWISRHSDLGDWCVNEYGLSTPNKTIYTPAPNNTLSLIGNTVE